MAGALSGSGVLLLLKQVHGATLVHAPWEGRAEGDAALAARRGFLLGIETADCLPLLFVDANARHVAAAHAGWRGTAAGVARRTVAALVAAGSRAEDIVVGIGPGIGPCCYEVGDELRSSLGLAAAIFFHVGPRGRSHLDVRAANVRQLLDAGVAEDRIQHVQDCTYCRSDLYHSYRREGQGAGRMISYIGWRRD